MSRPAGAIGLLLATAIVCLLPGCGKRGPVRHEITGTVLLKKQPLDEGVIEFWPVDGEGANLGSKDGAQILNGDYRIPREKGLFAGRYKIFMYAGDGFTGAGTAEPTSAKPGFKRGKERIPAKYNEKGEVFVVVTDDGNNRFDFDIP